MLHLLTGQEDGHIRMEAFIFFSKVGCSAWAINSLVSIYKWSYVRSIYHLCSHTQSTEPPYHALLMVFSLVFGEQMTCKMGLYRILLYSGRVHERGSHKRYFRNRATQSHSIFSDTTAPYRSLLRILVTIEFPKWDIADRPIVNVNFCVPRRPIVLEHLGYKIQIILVEPVVIGSANLLRCRVC